MKARYNQPSTEFGKKHVTLTLSPLCLKQTNWGCRHGKQARESYEKATRSSMPTFRWLIVECSSILYGFTLRHLQMVL